MLSALIDRYFLIDSVIESPMMKRLEKVSIECFDETFYDNRSNSCIYNSGSTICES